MGEELKPIKTTKRLQKISQGYYIAIPKDWFKAHNINPDEVEELLLIGDTHLVVVNPKQKDQFIREFYQKTSEEVKELIKKQVVGDKGEE